MESLNDERPSDKPQLPPGCKPPTYSFHPVNRKYRRCGYHNSNYNTYFFFAFGGLQWPTSPFLFQPKDGPFKKYLKPFGETLAECVEYDKRLEEIIASITSSSTARMKRLAKVKIYLFSDEFPAYLENTAVSQKEFEAFIASLNKNAVRTFIEATYPLELEMAKLSFFSKLYYYTVLSTPAVVTPSTNHKSKVYDILADIAADNTALCAAFDKVIETAALAVEVASFSEPADGAPKPKTPAFELEPMPIVFSVEHGKIGIMGPFSGPMAGVYQAQKESGSRRSDISVNSDPGEEGKKSFTMSAMHNIVGNPGDDFNISRI